jgi:hypothetical protein
LRHVSRHAPDSQANGAQLAAAPDGSPSVEPSMQYAPVMHAAVSGSHRVPFGHSALVVHAVGQLALAPSQANGAQVGAPTERASRNVHVPGVAVHVSHGESHGRSQHTPSVALPPGIAQMPDAHPLGFEQVLPAFVRQAPVPSHVLSPVQVSKSSSRVTAVQVPFVSAHDSHAPLHARSQQTPSAHERDAH